MIICYQLIQMSPIIKLFLEALLKILMLNQITTNLTMKKAVYLIKGGKLSKIKIHSKQKNRCMKKYAKNKNY